MIPEILSLTATAKVAYAAVASLTVSVATSATLVLAQLDGSVGSNDTVTTLIPAAALTTTSGALVWVVKQIVGGKLVHREPAEAQARLADSLKSVASLAEKSIEREKIYVDLLLKRTNERTRNDDR